MYEFTVATRHRRDLRWWAAGVTFPVTLISAHHQRKCLRYTDRNKLAPKICPCTNVPLEKKELSMMSHCSILRTNTNRTSWRMDNDALQQWWEWVEDNGI